MKELLMFLLFFAPYHLMAQQIDYNDEKGFIAGGYDVVAYFDGKAQKGKTTHSLKYENTNYKFVSAENLATFKKEPQKYIPQYGAWCAYAMGKIGEKVEVDPESYEIRNGRLYLFYNSYFSSAYKKWKSEGPETLAKQADENWAKIRYRN